MTDAPALIALPWLTPTLPLSSLPHTEGWTFGVLLGVFALWVLAGVLYPSFLSDDVPDILRMRERSSLFANASGSDPRLRMLYFLPAVLSIALFACLALFDPADGPFRFTAYTGMVAATAAFLLAKDGLIRLMCYVFFDETHARLTLRTYNTLAVCLGLWLYPVSLVMTYAPAPCGGVAQTVGLIGCAAGMALVVFKLFQIFFGKLLDCLYILLYLCTLEAIPLAALLHVYGLIV